jgi:fumarate hydratase subunit beta
MKADHLFGQRELISIQTPITTEIAKSLQAGDRVLISGNVYTARDAAHRKMFETLEAGKPLPISLQNETIYYVGPTPQFGNHIIGSAGPTTALRMDKYTPQLYHMGVRATIGKGDRSESVRQAIVETNAVYFAALGGTGALLSRHIVHAEVVAYPELGTEAIHRLTLEQFPVIVIYDCHGNDYYRYVQG